jgi:dTDP-4-amino-4,6-dideoxygalactose transaminase
MIKFQDLTRLHNSIKPQLQEAFDQVLQTSSFIQGKPVQQFEKDFSEFTGIPYCAGVANGTDAIEMALEVLGVGAGRENRQRGTEENW